MKFWLLLILAAFIHAEDIRIRQAEEKLEALFTEEIPKDNPNCGGIEGELDDYCYECYICEDERLKTYKSEAKKLKLKSADCKTVSTVCCVPQQNLITRSGDGTCGKKITETVISVHGKTQSKSTVRSVLIGEYPWRAWIYRKEQYGDDKVLCAGTVVGERTEVVMTSASCLQGLTSDDVVVSFFKDKNDAIDVRSIITHPSYTPSQKHEHDIALVVLSQAQCAPGWTSPICLSAAPPLPATTCVTISDNNSYISTVVPLPKKCESFNIRSALGQICAVSPLNDYVPEKGEALLCQDELRQTDDIYFAAGIALTTKESVTTYTAVYQYYDWITDKVNEIATNGSHCQN